MVALPLVLLVLALVLGVPIAVALAGAGMFGIYVVTGDFSKVMGIISLAPFSTVADYALTTIPMFILMAFFSASSGLARDLYTAASNWCSHIKGGLAIATVFACGIFGAMSGASTAAASVMSKIAMPEMRRHGYSDELAAGAIGIGATLDILIPPSIAMVIYGVATQTSIGKLLIAGVVPGLIAGVLLAAMIYLWVVVSPKHAPSTFRVSREERWASLVRIWPSLLLIFLVLVLLYTGIATPTEVGALGALLAGIIGAVFGRLTLADALDAVKSTIRTSAMIFLILIGATIFGYYMALSRIPQDMVSAVTAMDLNRWVVIIGIVVAYFIISMFMDEIPAAAAHAATHLSPDHVARLRSDLVRRHVDDDGGDGAGIPAGRPHRVHCERDGRRRSDEGLQRHQHSHDLDGDHHRAADDLSADRALAAGNDALVSRFRGSHHCAAHSFANFGIKGTLAIYDSSAVFGFEVPKQTRGYNDRNFKSTALDWPTGIDRPGRRIHGGSP